MPSSFLILMSKIGSVCRTCSMIRYECDFVWMCAAGEFAPIRGPDIEGCSSAFGFPFSRSRQINYRFSIVQEKKRNSAVRIKVSGEGDGDVSHSRGVGKRALGGGGLRAHPRNIDVSYVSVCDRIS